MAHDRQAETEPGARPAPRRRPEAIEDVRQQRRRNALAGIPHLDDDVAVRAAKRHVDPALLGRELDGVREQVPDDLLQAIGIRHDGPGLVEHDAEVDRLRGRGRPQRGDGGGDDRRRVHLLQRDPKPAGDDTREDEEVLDELGERVGVALDRFERARLAVGVEPAAAQPPDPAHQRIERRAQLVRERAEKLVLRAAGRLRVGARSLLAAQQVLACPRERLGLPARLEGAAVERDRQHGDAGEDGRARDGRRTEHGFGDDQCEDGGEECWRAAPVPASDHDRGEKQKVDGADEYSAQGEGEDGRAGHRGHGDRIRPQPHAHAITPRVWPAPASAGC